MKIECQIDIKAPIEKVFEAFSDLSQLEKRVAGIQSIEVLQGPAKMAVGTKWRELRVMFGKEATEEMWVTGLTKNKGYTVEAESHGTKYHSEYFFTEGPKGVNVKLIFQGTAVSFAAKVMSVLFFLFKGATVKALQQDMNDLKKVLEG